MSILKSTSWSLRGIIGFVIEMSQPGLNETLTEVVFLSAVTHLSLSSPVLPTFRCPTEYTLNWTHLLLQCLTLNFTESKSKGCWKRVTRKRKRTKRKRKKNLRSLFLWDLWPGCYSCLYFFFFVLLGVCIHCQYLGISALNILSVQPSAACKIKYSPGTQCAAAVQDA